MRMELHCHSHYSRGRKIPVEGLDSPADLVKAAKGLGLDGLALTDHSTSRGWAEAKEEAKRLGLLFIPAIEVSALEGHVIGLGLNEHVNSGLTFEETLDRIREQGGLAIAAHPFDIRREGLGRLSAKADAIETFNSMNLDRASNWQARRLAEKGGRPQIAGSDAHSKEMLGHCISHIDAHDMDSCLKEIRQGGASFSTSYIPLEKLLPWVKQRMLLSYGDVEGYIGSHYSQPKRWLSSRLLHAFTSSRREAPWYWLGEAGLKGTQAYGFLRAVF